MSQEPLLQKQHGRQRAGEEEGLEDDLNTTIIELGFCPDSRYAAWIW
jgi:hypothetical protein